MNIDQEITAEDNASYDFPLLLKVGDIATFDLVFKQYYAPLVAFASRYTAEDEREDVVQETMIWLWENRETIDPNKFLKSFLFTIVKNRCLNRISHKQVRNEVHQKLFDKFSVQFEDPDFYLRKELIQILDNAIKKLPDDYREAFEMHRNKEMTYQQISEIMGVSPKTIAYRISQALKILRTELKDYLPLILIFLVLEIVNEIFSGVKLK